MKLHLDVIDRKILAYLQEDARVGDYVIVSFIDEHPNDAELNLAIVVDKVYDSWS